MNSHVSSNRNESWTDEKHVHFLNSMEAWFVRTVLENNDRYDLRLDRQLPDSSESTLDCKHNTQTRRKHANSDFLGISRSKMKRRPGKRSRRAPPPPPPTPSQRHDSSHDQVVPQIEHITGDKEERDLPNCTSCIHDASIMI